MVPSAWSGLDHFAANAGIGEARDQNSKARQIILANAIEAIIGALYLDKGIPAARKFIKKCITRRLSYILAHQLNVDPKSSFQEFSQAQFSVTPSYRVLSESGPDHNKTFVVGVYLRHELIAKGEGTSKQSAQEEAARKALLKKHVIRL